MKLKEVLQEIETVQKKIGADKCMVCGGTVRDKYLNKLKNISDIDLTNGTKNIDYVSQEVAIALKRKYNITRKTMEDGHSSIYLGNLKIDFSSNFIIDDIDQILLKLGIKNATNLQKEMFSRDFTCNSLLMEFDLKTITDPTKRGFKDLDSKIIRTCLAPDITLVSNKNRVVRSIYLASKLDFDVDKSIIEFVKKNPEVINISSRKSLVEKLDDAFKYNPERASNLLTNMGLWDLIPISETINPYYLKNRGKMSEKKAYYQGGGGENEPAKKGKKKYPAETHIVDQARFMEPLYRNFDYADQPGVDGPAKHGPGTGYNAMQNYKSVQDFLKARRKKLKGKYKAQDQYIHDDGTISAKKANERLSLLYSLAKDENEIDFAIDEQINDPILSGAADIDGIGTAGYSSPIGGRMDQYLPSEDPSGKKPEELNYGQQKDDPDTYDRGYLDELSEKMSEKYSDGESFEDDEDDTDLVLTPKETDTYGLPDGMLAEEKDNEYDPNTGYGATNTGTNIYNQ